MRHRGSRSIRSLLFPPPPPAASASAGKRGLLTEESVELVFEFPPLELCEPFLFASATAFESAIPHLLASFSRMLLVKCCFAMCAVGDGIVLMADPGSLSLTLSRT